MILSFIKYCLQNYILFRNIYIYIYIYIYQIYYGTCMQYCLISYFNSELPCFDTEIIICWQCMHEYRQPHETNLNIKKKLTTSSCRNEECARFNPHEGFEFLILCLSAADEHFEFLHDKFKLLQTIFVAFYKFIICFSSLLYETFKKVNE